MANKESYVLMSVSNNLDCTVDCVIMSVNNKTKDVIYFENICAGNLLKNASKIKDLYLYYKVDYIILDVKGFSLLLYDALTTGKDLSLKVLNDGFMSPELYNKLELRTYNIEGIPCICVIDKVIDYEAMNDKIMLQIDNREIKLCNSENEIDMNCLCNIMYYYELLNKKIKLNSVQQNFYNNFIDNYNILLNKEINIRNPKYEYDTKGYKNIIYSHGSSLRCCGKTWLCLYMAHKFKYDIIVNNRTTKKLHEKYMKDLCLYGFNIYSITELQGREKLSTVIIFDDVQLTNMHNNIISQLEDLYGNLNIIGFSW